MSALNEDGEVIQRPTFNRIERSKSCNDLEEEDAQLDEFDK